MAFECIPNCSFCCSPVPFKESFLIKNQIKQIRPVTKLIRDMNEDIIPFTKDMKCIFLTNDNKCNIYEDRPEICRTYGLNNKQPCPYVNPKGDFRTVKRSEYLEEQFKKRLERMSKQ